jgi:hypothetical protein
MNLQYLLRTQEEVRDQQAAVCRDVKVELRDLQKQLSDRDTGSPTYGAPTSQVPQLKRLIQNLKSHYSLMKEELRKAEDAVKGTRLELEMLRLKGYPAPCLTCRFEGGICHQDGGHKGWQLWGFGEGSISGKSISFG